MTEDQAKQRMAQIAMMPSVIMIGVDRKNGGGVTIGMELDRSNGAESDLNDLMLGLMTAYVGINLRSGISEETLIERTAKTLAVVLKNIGEGTTETARTETVTLH